MRLCAVFIPTLIILGSMDYLDATNQTQPYFSESCPVKHLMDQSLLNGMRTLMAIRDLEAKLVNLIYPGEKKSKNACPLAAAYIDSGTIFEKYDIVQRLDFNKKVMDEYGKTLENVKQDEEKKSGSYFLTELKKVISRMHIDQFRILKRRKVLITPPCLGTDRSITLWRRFSPVYPNATPDPCNRNKLDEILTIVQDIKTIYRITQAWYFQELKKHSKFKTQFHQY